VLSYHTRGQIRFLDIYGCSQAEDCIDTRRWKRHLIPNHQGQSLLTDLPPSISHLTYSNGILACVCEISETGESWLVVLDSSKSKDPSGPEAEQKRQVLLREPLNCTTKLFVRQNGSYLYYGTHSAFGSHGHHEWMVQGFDLANGQRVTQKPLQLVDFFGSELGSTVCFEIHNGSFYAVSNQTSLEVEEVDWTSHYHCIQFALDERKPNLKPRKLWRRQHKEGPLNDSWTELSIQKDEQTDELLIVECRKEYMGGGSTNVRTYYMQPLSQLDGDDVPRDFGYPTNDPLTKTLDDNSKPNYEPAKKRIRRYYHPEYPSGRVDPAKEFILAKTKFRAYNVATSSFIDLVNDPVSRPGFARLQDRVRLRVASRLQKSPLEDDPENPGHLRLRMKEVDENDIPLEHGEEDFHETEVQELWPPDNAPTGLSDVLCPGGRIGQVDAMSDDTAIVYMTGLTSANPNGERAIILINFDPFWKHDGLKTINFRSNPPELVDTEVQKNGPYGAPSSCKRSSPMSVDSDDESPAFKKQKYAAEASTSGDQQQYKARQPKTEPAQYLFNQGYWFIHQR
jgi:hypothetical protein